MSDRVSWGNPTIDTACKKLLAGQTLTYQEALKADRILGKIDVLVREENMPRSITIALGGNIATDFLGFGLRVGLASSGINATVHVTNYNNWTVEAISGEVKADFWVVWLTAIGATRGGVTRTTIDFEAIQIACQKILSRGQKILMILPEALEMENNPYSPFRSWRNHFSTKLDETLPADVIRLPVDHLQRNIGSAQWFAPHYWTMTKAPCNPNAATTVAIEAAKTISQTMLPRIKAIIADLDNTLWGGVIGDDGLENIKLDPFSEGRPFLMMQQFLKDIQSTGVPLNIVSKNEPENARSPFVSSLEMPLNLDDFVYFEASWEPKHIAISRITKQLNIGLDAVCFLDDSPHERAEAKKVLPELVVPELAENPEQRVRELAQSGLFMSPVIHQDDIQRVKRYNEGVQRQKSQENAVSLEDYYSDLAMVLSPLDIDSTNINRAGALIQKTNQFNMTNRRHTVADIHDFTGDKSSYMHCFSLADRFGDSGIVSVVIGIIKDGRLEIDTWVLSCRAFGRGVEFAILHHILEWMQQKKIVELQVPYVPSAKNKLLLDFLSKSGFSEVDGVARAEPTMQLFTLSTSTKIPQHMLTIQGS